MLELTAADAWDRLAGVWKGVQADLGLPAPAIALSGTGAYQLWFSVAEPVPGARAIAFLAGLRERYLADVAPARVTLHPSVDASGRVRHVDALPPAQAAPGRWSAFVLPDLAALFAEEPWLDLPPSADAQADILSRLQGMPAGALEPPLADVVAAPAAGEAPPAPGAGATDPRSFLLSVMNDPSIALPLRIEAAKALLQPGRP